MRRGWIVPFLLSLTCCSEGRSFDDRYADTQIEIEQRATRLDADLQDAERIDRSVDDGSQ